MLGEAFAAITSVAVIMVLPPTTTFVTDIPEAGIPPCVTLTVTGLMKLVPVRVTFTLVPSVPLFGFTIVSVGAGGFTLNDVVGVTPFEVTETVRTGGDSVALPLITNVAVMVVEFTRTTLEAVTPLPLTATVTGLTKFVPLMVTGTLVPWTPTAGLTPVTVGAPIPLPVNATL